MEEEIIKHSRKIFSALKKPNQSFIKKTIEVGIEVFIIVFAVSLSIRLHSLNEHSKEQKEVRVFLNNIREDLKQDIEWLKADIELYKKDNEIFINILASSSSNSDSLKFKNKDVPFPLHIFMHKINNGNYEGFKASGKIGFIENEDLKKSILNYYQQIALNITDLNDLYTQYLIKTFDLLEKSDDLNSLNSKMQLRIEFLNNLAENNIMVSNERPIKIATEIITKIDKELSK